MVEPGHVLENRKPEAVEADREVPLTDGCLPVELGERRKWARHRMRFTGNLGPERQRCACPRK